MMPVIDSFTIYHSPNAYLGIELARRVFADIPVTHRRRPIFIPRARGVRVADLVGGHESKARASYHREDCLRWARRHRVPLHLIEPEEFERRATRWKASAFEREELPARAFYAAQELGGGAAMDQALFAAAWVLRRDVNDEGVIRDAATAAGLDADSVLERACAVAAGQQAQEALAAFESLQCPGVPTFVWAGQRYWGKDRVDEVAADVCAARRATTGGSSST